MPRDLHRRSWPRWVLLTPLMLLGVASARWLSQGLPACLFYDQTGLLCPGCGATRSAMALADGRWLEALRNNGLFVMAVILGGLWILLSAARVRFPSVGWLRIFQGKLWFLWLALGLLAAFGIGRNLPGMEWLGPQ